MSGRRRALALITRQAVADAAGRRAPTIGATTADRIDAALEWLCRAQDHGTDRGVSYGYTIGPGWRPSYIETTGYIIATFLWAADALDRPALRDRAEEAGRWLVSVQLDDGGFANPAISPTDGVVFDTGQDLHGLVSLIRTGTNDDGGLLDGARRAARWLVDVADDHGRWTRNTFNGIPHVYNARSAWALVRAGQLLDDPDAIGVARANLDWACSQQEGNGWFNQCAFTPNAPPFTHTTAYAGRGLFEAGVLLHDNRYIDAARGVAAAAARHVRPDGALPGRIGIDDHPVGRSTCLTGNAQFAILWLRLATHDGDDGYRTRALRALDAVGVHQRLTGPPEIRGAIKGSHPIWGRYAPLGYPNWATKFFLDGLLLAQAGSIHPEAA